MTTTSFKMVRHLIASLLMTAIISIVLFGSCKKEETPFNEVSTYSSDVLDKWMTLQVRLMRSSGIANHATSRQFAYSGIAALESVAPGLPPYLSRFRRWNGLTGLPVANQAYRYYYYPANINAAMATINRAFFTNSSANDKAAIDSLESALNAGFLTEQPEVKVKRSADFGKAVAIAVFNWSETDGHKVANNPYTPPTGPGLWKPTPPAGAPAITPYWGNNRTVVIGSIANTTVSAPIAYSTDPSSPFYQMVKKVFDTRNNLTQEQKDIAMYWRGVPGVTSPGHWLSIAQQSLRKTNAKLDKAVLVYALTGSAINDAIITGWKNKYFYNLVRPVTYIREVMGHGSWESFIGTPAHPEYPSGHSFVCGAAATTLEKLMGNIGTIADHTYDYLGVAARSYSSFTAIAEEAALSRLYGGIHYEQSLTVGLDLGNKVANNIFSNRDTR